MSPPHKVTLAPAAKSKSLQPHHFPGSLSSMEIDNSSGGEELELSADERARTHLLNKLWSPDHIPPPVRWEQANIPPYMFVPELFFDLATVAGILRVPISSLPRRQSAMAVGWDVVRVGRLSGLENSGWKKEVEQLGLAALGPECEKLAGYVLRVTPEEFGRIKLPQACNLCKFRVYLPTEEGVMTAKAFGWEIDVRTAQQVRAREEAKAEKKVEKDGGVGVGAVYM